MVPQWQTGIVKRIEQATHNTRRYWVELPETESFLFKPGQFVTLDLPIHEQRNKRWRSYSIASIPDGSNFIELLIVHLEGGIASKYIFDEIKEGSTFTLRGPQGIFVLPEVADKDLYLICTGTGIAPFRSMVQYISKHNLPHKQIHLIFGTRTQEDILYRDEMTALQNTMPGFNYHVTLSREDWDGNKGYVHKVYEGLCAEKPDTLFMLCGWRAMIDEAKQRLLAMGYDKKAIHAELYG
jgi:ferredoxin-NADP reductase